MDEAYMDEMGMHPMDEEEKKTKDKWKDERPSGCKCPDSSRSNKKCPIHGLTEAVKTVDEMDMPEVDEMYSEMDEVEEMVSQAIDRDGQDKNAQSNKQLRQVESIRSKMAKELKLQESLRKRASQLKKLYSATQDVATLFEAKKVAPHAAQLKAVYTKTAELYNGSVTRFNKLSRTLEEGLTKNVRSNSNVKPGASAGTDTLSKKLAETNLLNAKLLFTNKLLQAESLTARQKAQIIEQLDSAETIREAKLVYESLSKALMKTRTTVTESRILGSSSQATRPASTQTLNEGVEAERWAKLAGIK
jgi:hypothetical protein